MAVQPQQTNTTTNVVVWEWLTQPNCWKAYTPTVSQILEKARRNKLTQVLLGDADPSLSQLRVSLTSMVQICELKEEACPVRRMLYPRSSPAGQGIRWDWLGDKFAEWIEYEMDAQIAIESGWSKGLQTLDLSKHCHSMPYIINFCNLTQVRKDTGFVRSVRRVQQASYPAAMRNEVPPEPVPIPVTKQDTSEKSHAKPNWLAGIMNAVKSPNKQAAATEPKTPKHGRRTSEASVTETKAPTSKDGNTQQQRGRRESRLALRVERRAPRSSSLDTVSTCLSQESVKRQIAHQIGTPSMV